MFDFWGVVKVRDVYLEVIAHFVPFCTFILPEKSEKQVCCTVVLLEASSCTCQNARLLFSSLFSSLSKVHFVLATVRTQNSGTLPLTETALCPYAYSGMGVDCTSPLR